MVWARVHNFRVTTPFFAAKFDDESVTLDVGHGKSESQSIYVQFLWQVEFRDPGCCLHFFSEGTEGFAQNGVEFENEATYASQRTPKLLDWDTYNLGPVGMGQGWCTMPIFKNFAGDFSGLVGRFRV